MTPHLVDQGPALEVSVTAGKPVIVTVPIMHAMDIACDWLAAARPVLRALLLRHGNVYLRGLPISSSEDFAVIRDIFLASRAQYKEKATPRSSYGNDIFSSTDLPAMQAIRLHNENSYTLEFPGVLGFCCLEAPDEGGATTIADSRQVLANVPRAIADRFRVSGWRLVRHYKKQVSLPWNVAFGTDERSRVEAYCEANKISARWIGEDGLATTQRRPAIIRHPATGEESWFNHVAFWNSWALDDDVREVLVDTYGADGLPFETFLGDGQLLTQDDVRQLMDAYDAATCREQWRKGDVMFVDNILCAHGRDAFRGSRRVLVAMGEPVAMTDCSPFPQPSAT